MRRVVVTGASSGLGRALRGAFGAQTIAHGSFDAEVAAWTGEPADVVVHCAADARKTFPADEIEAYRRSNLDMTERLLDLPHRVFVYVSSHAVYPTDDRAWREDDALEVSEALSIYGVFKLLAEDLVRRRARRHLVLRCASLVGPGGRRNNIMRILRRQPGSIFLAGDCAYSLIAYSQVADFIRESVARDREGIFNLGAAATATLAEIAARVGAPVEFGRHRYTAPRADLSKLHTATRIFDATTLEVADRVVAELGDGSDPPSA